MCTNLPQATLLQEKQTRVVSVCIMAVNMLVYLLVLVF